MAGVQPELSRRSALKGLAAAAAAGAGAVPLLDSQLAAAAPPARADGHGVTGGADSGGRAGTGPKLTGRVVYPSDTDYVTASAGWDRLFSSYPQAVVFCHTADDVVRAVQYARHNDIALRARSGRHSLEGWSSVDGGIVIDVSPLKTIKIDPHAKTATVGTGLNQGELVDALANTPFGFPTGDEASVGLGGVMLGGGIGVLSPRMGVACDNLLAVEIVVPTGTSGARLVRADLRRHPDLLWACRGGGGGNFGIATSFTVRLHDMPRTVGVWQVTYPFSALHDAFDAWQRWAHRADTRLGSTFNVGTPSVGLTVDGVFLGPPERTADMVKPLLGAAGARFKSSTQKWVDHYRATNAVPEIGDHWKFTPMWAGRPIPREGIDTIRDMLAQAPSDGCSFWCLGWGGAVRTPPRGGSAFFWRAPLFYAEPGAGWNGAERNSSHIGWIEQFRNAMRPYVEGGYVNVPDRAIADWGTAYYGTHFARLRAIKKKYDPNEVFSFEQSIPLPR